MKPKTSSRKFLASSRDLIKDKKSGRSKSQYMTTKVSDSAGTEATKQDNRVCSLTSSDLMLSVPKHVRKKASVHRLYTTQGGGKNRVRMVTAVAPTSGTFDSAQPGLFSKLC